MNMTLTKNSTSGIHMRNINEWNRSAGTINGDDTSKPGDKDPQPKQDGNGGKKM